MKIYRLLILGFLSLFWGTCLAEYKFTVGGDLNVMMGSSDFAPYYMHANRHGKLTQSKNVQLGLWATDSLDLSRRFDFSWGVEVLGGYSSKVDYKRWNPESKEWGENPQGPAPIWIQQLYGEIKWRCLFLRVGLKDNNSYFVNQELSSGDLLWSGNSRGIPEARIGFVDFQDIPLTKKWLQFDIALSYGKFIDTKWVNNHFDYYTGKRNPGPFWTYKRASIRSNPDFPFMMQGGFQMAGIFGGKTYYYADGNLRKTENNYSGFKDFFQMLLPFWSNEREGYRVGDTKGTWDISARYRFRGGETLKAYFQDLWEDSSGLAKQNGFDGLWGLEFNLGRRWWISNVVAEYVDLTNMSGPLGYDPGYHNTTENGATMPEKVGGRDGYYNNSYYRCYTNYGLNIGTPMVQGLLFYTGDNPNVTEDGVLPYFRVRGFHIAVEGAITDNCDYIVKYNHRKAWGDTNKYTLIHPTEADSFIAGATYRITKIPGLSISAAIGVDHGSMPSNAVGGMISLTYERGVSLRGKR